MPSHWTYQDFQGTNNLEQGDILQPTDGLREIFSQVHPHFANSKYLGYIVTTQSCDLVRRKSDPKAAYINVAAIRPLVSVIPKLLSKIIPSIEENIYKESDKLSARQFLERVINQNEQSLGLFFLHPDSDAGIAEAAVAYLRVAVALRSEHYDAILAARTGRLTPEFRAKLGWLTGNLYVRPATPDWSDQPGGERRFKALILEFMSGVRWVDNEIAAAVAKDGSQKISEMSDSELEKFRQPSALDRAINEVLADISRVDAQIPPETSKKLANRLRNNGKFTKLFAKPAAQF